MYISSIYNKDMRKLIKKLVIEGLVLVENKLYNDKIISGVTKKDW